MHSKKKSRPYRSSKKRSKTKAKLNRIIIIGVVLFLAVIFIKISLIREKFPVDKNLIVIDAGHGGRDSGAVGIKGSLEKDINLDIAKKLALALKKKGYKTILTRDKDRYVENKSRAELANKNKAHLFISIHNNSLDNNDQVEGIQVLFHPDKSRLSNELDSKKLAEFVMDSLVHGTGAKNKGIIERKDLIVLNKTKMPAILIECGFLSNEKEEKLLLTNSYQNKIVNSIVIGLSNYLDHDSN